LASQFTTVVLLGQSGGLYNHYFDTFLNPIDLLWSFLQAVLMGFGGLDITPSGIVQTKSTLPPGWKSLTLKGIGPEKKTYVIK